MEDVVREASPVEIIILDEGVTVAEAVEKMEPGCSVLANCAVNAAR